MKDSLIKSISNQISKKFKIHVEYSITGDNKKIEDFYLSRNGVRVNGLDLSKYLNLNYGLNGDESKIIITDWINVKFPGENILEREDLTRNFWVDFRPMWFSGSTSVNLTGDLNFNYDNIIC